MGRNRKKHKRKKKEKIIKYSVKEVVPVVSQTDTSGTDEKGFNKSVNWSNMRVLSNRQGRRGPRYV